MERTAKPFNHLPDIPNGWCVAVHPGRCQPYATWRDGKVWHFDKTYEDARRYVDQQERTRLRVAGKARGEQMVKAIQYPQAVSNALDEVMAHLPPEVMGATKAEIEGWTCLAITRAFAHMEPDARERLCVRLLSLNRVLGAQEASK